MHYMFVLRNYDYCIVYISMHYIFESRNNTAMSQFN